MPLVLAVSPHLDDAALSASGQLRGLVERGDVVEVVTLFAGIPHPPYSAPAVFMHGLWGFPENPVEQRRAEDRCAHQQLGTRAEHADFLDELYRRTPDGDWLIRDDWKRAADTGGDERELRSALAAYVHELLVSRRPDLVLTCAAVGRHIDHRRTRDAVLTAAPVAGVPVRLWEDVPYAEWTSQFPPLPQWAAVSPPSVEPFDEQVWERKMSAVQCYASQHRMLWPEAGRDDWRAELDRHATNVGLEHGAGRRAERFWDVMVDASQLPVNVGPPDLRVAAPHELDPSLYDLITRPSLRR
jgi:LmbE family N-acetylglucosaminyl deacetylase